MRLKRYFQPAFPPHRERRVGGIRRAVHGKAAVRAAANVHGVRRRDGQRDRRRARETRSLRRRAEKKQQRENQPYASFHSSVTIENVSVSVYVPATGSVGTV